MANFQDWNRFLAYFEDLGDPYYRVEDEVSQAVTLPGRELIDFRARYGWTLRVLKRNVINHINWQSPYVSSLISTCRDENAAWAEAERRVARGRRNTITVLDAQKVYGQVEYRNLCHLARELNIPIPRKACIVMCRTIVSKLYTTFILFSASIIQYQNSIAQHGRSGAITATLLACKDLLMLARKSNVS